MKFFIPSFKRANDILKLTLKCIDFAPMEDIYIFVDKDEYETYKNAVGSKANIVCVEGKGIVRTRRHMQIFARDNGIDNFFMFDDDLGTFQKRSELSANGKFYFLKNVERGEETKKYLEQMEKDCLDNHKIFVGVCPRRMGWKLQKDMFFKSLPYGFEWVNNKWYIENGAYIPEELYRFEDVWMGLITVEKTGKIDHVCTYQNLIANMRQSNVKGGCSSYLYVDQEQNRKAFEEFGTKFFPSLDIKPKIRHYNNGWINYAIGLDWKSPFKVEGENRKISIFGKKNIKQEEDFLTSISVKW